jgi:hypothetical protein
VGVEVRKGMGNGKMLIKAVFQLNCNKSLVIYSTIQYPQLIIMYISKLLKIDFNIFTTQKISMQSDVN